MSHAGTPARRDAALPARPGSQDRSPQVIQAEMETARNRLADTVDQLAYRAHPKTVVKRRIEEIKSRFVDENGQPRTEEIAKAAGAAAGFLTVLLTIRKIVNR